MTERKEVNPCELCGEKPAVTLCPECPKCYCRACSEFVHKKDSKKDHRTEIIPEGVAVNATCPLHRGALGLFCVDEAMLCCSVCKEDKLHKGHKMVDITEIIHGSSLFSAGKVREDFEDAMKRGDALGRKIGETIESIDRGIAETKEKIRKLFEEEHRKLWDEESRLMDELEMRSNYAKEMLMDNLNTLECVREYSSVLSEAYAGVTSDGCSKLMELNIVSEMEKQREEVGKVLRAEMRYLGVEWDEKARKVSFTRRLFSGAPSVRNLIVNAVSWREVEVSWEVSCEEESDGARYTVGMRKEGERQWKVVKNLLVGRKCSVGDLKEGSSYEFRVRCVAGEACLAGEWSDVVVYTPPQFKEGCVWRECPSYINWEREYIVDEKNPRIAAKINDGGYGGCTITGSIAIPLSAVTSWSVKILESKDNNCDGIFIGIVPFDINQNDEWGNYNKCGWYFNCYHLTLWSGPPHKYRDKGYGPRKEENGQYVHTGDSVGVMMDTAKDELSFALNGVNLGLAFEKIPLDKPLVPCVLLGCEGDSVELDTSEVKENVDNSISTPSNIVTKSFTWDSITLTWDKVNDASFYQIEMDGNKSWYANTTNNFTKRELLPETEHSFRVRIVKGNSVGKWSGIIEGKTTKIPEFSKCVWKECPKYVYESRKYSVDKENPKITTVNNSSYWCTIIGSIAIPLNTVTSWSVKILKSKNNDGYEIYIGVAPFDVNQNEVNYGCGWYLNCYRSELRSGPPHNYSGKEYGPRKENGEYVHTGDSVGVVVDTARGELSFILNGVNLGLAFEGVLLDKPLVPYAILCNEGDSVELDTSEVKENVDNSISTPSNIIAKSSTWDTITLTWNKVNDASFYQIEVNGNKTFYATTTNTFTKRELFPETEYSFRVRAMRGSSVSEWSGVVKGRTLKGSFETSAWKACPDDVDEDMKYNVDGWNLRVATKINGDGYCTIIGNTHIPPNTITSWSVNVLSSMDDDGDGIYIGVAPSNINQNEDDNYTCGWYFYCYYSTLYSGHPHNYRGKEYGPRGKEGGKYVHTGDSVGVVVDTTKGNLSFVLNGVNLGVAYSGISLDKPLVPCVILKYKGDSIELDTSEVKENVDNSIPVPSNITAKSIIWDSITLTWDKINDASFYQIEVDENKSWYANTTNNFTKRELLPETEHSFRVRTVKRSSVSEWSDIVKGRTLKTPEFSECMWKECPDDVNEGRKYNVYRNTTTATKINDNSYCTIIGDAFIPPNTVTSWDIKVLRSKGNNGYEIFIGIAPFDINQNNDNYNICGWYFSCLNSMLWSGPPHNYWGKEYGPRKDLDKHIYNVNSIGVVMDTTKGDLSFVLNNVNLGVAFKKIPLDKPLVPCVLLFIEGDSVELIT